MQLVDPVSPAARGDAPAAVACLPLAPARRRVPASRGLALGAVSLVASAWLYAVLWGWELSLGLVVGMYAHELGHLWALRSQGFSASAPVFVPFVGAVVRARTQPTDPRGALAVALAGPAAGLACATGFGIAYLACDVAVLGWLALALVALNLCDLLPFPLLDGGRALAALRALEG
jgi:Zn-dependent protease